MKIYEVMLWSEDTLCDSGCGYGEESVAAYFNEKEAEKHLLYRYENDVIDKKCDIDGCENYSGQDCSKCKHNKNVHPNDICTTFRTDDGRLAYSYELNNFENSGGIIRTVEVFDCFVEPNFAS